MGSPHGVCARVTWTGPKTCPHSPEACMQVLSACPALPSCKERSDSDSPGWSPRTSRKGAEGSLGCPGEGVRDWSKLPSSTCHAGQT